MRKLFLLFAAAALPILLSAQPTLIYHGTFNGNANDLSGNGHHGILMGGGAAGGPTFTAGFSGAPNSAILLNGLNQWVQLPTHVDFNLQTWTLQAMIRPQGFYAGACQSNAIIWHGTHFSSNYYGMYFTDNYVDLSCGVTTPAGNRFTGNAAGNPLPMPSFAAPANPGNPQVLLNQWYCVTATYNGSAVRLYLDGALVAIVNWPNLYNYAGGPVPVYIGRSNDIVNFPYWFNGIIDQVSIWRGAMQAWEIGGYCDKTEVNSWKQTQNGKGEEEAVSEGIKETNMAVLEGDMKVYPSPAQDQINIDIPESFNDADLVIMNGVGQVLFQQKATTGKLNVDISKYPTGIYIVKIFKNDSRRVEKFVKE